MEDITKVDIDEFVKQHPEEDFLSSEEINAIRIKTGKSRIKARDFEEIEKIMEGHSLFVLMPSGNIFFVRSVSRYLVDGQSLMLFTNLHDCKEYLNMLYEQHGPGDWKIGIGTISIREALRFVREHRLFAAVDYATGPDMQAFLYDGKKQVWFSSLDMKF